MQKYQKATKEEAYAYVEKGRVWVRSNTHFSSCRGWLLLRLPNS